MREERGVARDLDYHVAFAIGAVEHWQRPSEMLDEIGRFVPLVVGWTVEGEGLAEGARRYARFEANGVDLSSFRAWDELIGRLVARDRLRAWKLALYGWLDLERAWLLVSPNERAQCAMDHLIATLDEQWTSLDDMPPGVAARYAYALAGKVSPQHGIDAIARQRPALLRTIVASPVRDIVPIPPWLLQLANQDPVRALKIGLEAFLRGDDGSAYRGLVSHPEGYVN